MGGLRAQIIAQACSKADRGFKSLALQGKESSCCFYVPSNDVAHLKTIKYKRNKNNWYIGSFMYPSAVVLCCCALLCVVVCCYVLLCVGVCKRGGE